MKKLLLGSVGTLALIVAGQPVVAADMPILKAPIAVAPVSPWEFEYGTRLWFSTGRSAKDLYSNVAPNVMVSRLTYADTQATSSELVFRGEHHPTGLFVKGFAGRGAITSGKMNDEDFAPQAVPTYSNTLQETHNGRLSYLTVDAGWMFYDGMKNPVPGPSYEGLRHLVSRLGVFVGFNYWNEFARTYGCSQQAGGTVCVPSPVTTGQYSLGQDNTWRSLRVGLTGEVAMGPSVSLVVDAAYLRTNLSGFDHHKLRPDIDPLHEIGTGNGFQLDAMLNYHVTDTLNVGVGARYWRNFTTGSVTFPGAATPSPERWEAQRAGLIVQATNKFDGVNVANTNAAIATSPNLSIWSGFYGGFNAGWGRGQSNATLTGTNAFSQGLINGGFIAGTLRVGEDGNLAGGQAGYNHMVNSNWVVGIEVDMDYAKLSGAEAFSRVIPLGGGRFELLNTTVDREINWLGTVRGRVGFLATPALLLYGTGGFAFGETTLHTEINDSITGTPPGLLTTSGARAASRISTGWTGGFGVEHAFNRWSSVKVEYLYVNLGTQNNGVTVINAASYNTQIANTTNLLRGGMNFKF